MVLETGLYFRREVEKRESGQPAPKSAIWTKQTRHLNKTQPKMWEYGDGLEALHFDVMIDNL